MLRAMHASGRPCVVKLLDTRVSLDSSEQPGGAGAAAVRLVCDTAAVEKAVPVVQAELITLHLSADHRSTGHGPGKYAAIVMPQYCGSVAAQVQMSEAAIEAGAQRMLCALEYVHSKELVHMDVKVQNLLPREHNVNACICLALQEFLVCSLLHVMQGDNIFVDMAGDWWLGDLGSAVEVRAAVQSTTDWFSQQNLKGQPAKTTYDWYMLAVALAAEVHKADWKEKLLENGHSPAAKVVAAVQEVQKQSLLNLLQVILRRAEVL